MATKPSKSDLAEIGRGKGSARDKREAAGYARRKNRLGGGRKRPKR